MQNSALVRDYLVRAGKRLLAVEVLHRQESWADVVRECQELVELTLKALLRASAIEVPRIHDVSGILDAERIRLPEKLRPHVDDFIVVSKSLRRDRELAFYGSEDLTPSEFYSQADADTALASARRVHQLVSGALRPPPGP